MQEEIVIRRELIGQMVGCLYPSILTDEIADLANLLDKMKSDQFPITEKMFKKMQEYGSNLPNKVCDEDVELE